MSIDAPHHITLSETKYERIFLFLLLKWFYSDHHTHLDFNQIESMSIMHSFWITNIKKEMAFYGT